jgi:hypothetical protein
MYLSYKKYDSAARSTSTVYILAYVYFEVVQACYKICFHENFRHVKFVSLKIGFRFITRIGLLTDIVHIHVQG